MDMYMWKSGILIASSSFFLLSFFFLFCGLWFGVCGYTHRTPHINTCCDRRSSLWLPHPDTRDIQTPLMQKRQEFRGLSALPAYVVSKSRVYSFDFKFVLGRNEEEEEERKRLEGDHLCCGYFVTFVVDIEGDYIAIFDFPAPAEPHYSTSLWRHI